MQLLRKKGYSAWFHHGDARSTVFVGSFGENALLQQRRQGVLVNMPNAEVQALQARESFRYELWNMKARSSAYGEKRLARPSQLVRVHEEEEFGGFS